METTKKSLLALVLPALLLPMLMVAGFLVAPGTETQYARLGLFPRDISHLYGILTTPLLHGSVSHLWGNLSSLVVLGLLFRFSFPRLFWSTTAAVWLLGGFWTWLVARDNFHIGASGIVYGYVAFLVASGIVGKNYRLVALSLLTIFLYGSLVWGLLPIDPTMSFESHGAGAAAGLIMAVYHRSRLPKRRTYAWEEEPETEGNGSVYREVRAMEKAGIPLPEITEAVEEIPLSQDPFKILYAYKPNTPRVEKHRTGDTEEMEGP